jgi:nitric oxide reductase NorD protein
VERAGHDYLKTMCEDIGYEVVADIEALPADCRRSSAS